MRSRSKPSPLGIAGDADGTETAVIGTEAFDPVDAGGEYRGVGGAGARGRDDVAVAAGMVSGVGVKIEFALPTTTSAVDHQSVNLLSIDSATRLAVSRSISSSSTVRTAIS